MKLNLFLLSSLAFLAGLTELVVSGILPFIADDYDISISKAGSLVTVFAVLFAVSGPILMSRTSKWDRRSALIIFVTLFIIGNFLTVFSVNFMMLMTSRIILALSVAMVIGLALSVSVKIVEPSFQVKAISILLMCISSSLVLGVPSGIFLSGLYGWKTIFIIIGILSTLLLLGILKYFPRNIPLDHSSTSDQWGSLLNPKIALSHIAVLLFFIGQSTFFIYYTPYLERGLIEINLISVIYLMFGLFAIIGGGLGGVLADKLGKEKTMISVIALYVCVMASFYFIGYSLVPLFIATALWGLLGWTMNAPQQSYLITEDPDNAGFNQTINTSSVQFGISIGSLIGGLLLVKFEVFDSLIITGTLFIILSLLFMTVSVKMRSKTKI